MKITIIGAGTVGAYLAKYLSGEQMDIFIVDVDADKLMSLILEIRQDAKTNKNWTVADLIRNKLTEMGITLKDTKEGTSYELN